MDQETAATSKVCILVVEGNLVRVSDPVGYHLRQTVVLGVGDGSSNTLSIRIDSNNLAPPFRECSQASCEISRSTPHVHHPHSRSQTEKCRVERSEERRVGKECRSRRTTEQENTK